METDGYQTYGYYFIMYANVKSLCTPETNCMSVVFKYKIIKMYEKTV